MLEYLVTLTLALLGAVLAWLWSKPRALRDAESWFGAESGHYWMDRWTRPGTTASVLQVVRTVCLDRGVHIHGVRIGAPPSGGVDVGVVVPWTAVAPWRRSSVELAIKEAVEASRPAGLEFRTRMVWR